MTFTIPMWLIYTFGGIAFAVLFMFIGAAIVFGGITKEVVDHFWK